MLTPVSEPAFIGGIGGPELLIILLIVLLLFGSKKLPELAKGMGKSIKEFKKATEEVESDFRSAMDAVESDKPASDTPKTFPRNPEEAQTNRQSQQKEEASRKSAGE